MAISPLWPGYGSPRQKRLSRYLDQTHPTHADHPAADRRTKHRAGAMRSLARDDPLWFHPRGSAMPVEDKQQNEPLPIRRVLVRGDCAEHCHVVVVYHLGRDHLAVVE
jgi:hypothetical protein